MHRLCPVLLWAASLHAAKPPTGLAAQIAAQAELFAVKAQRAISQETLVQRCYRIPPHPHLAIGHAADTLHAQYVVTEIVSQYSIGVLKGDEAGKLLELRELVSMNGKPVQTPEAARKALELGIVTSEERTRKKLLGEFTDLGLVDVATDYGLILLAFNKSGLAGMQLTPAGSAWIGVEPAVALDWRQTTGGVLEFRGRKTTRRPMHGQIWVRESDGMPLRISASIEHDEPKHALRDDATVDYVLSSFGCVTPASVVHRHSVDGAVLTENLYTYAPFRLFSTDITIRYSGTTAPPKQ